MWFKTNKGQEASIGSVIVATRDSDFTLLARALEETLGVGVAKNASELAQWL